MKEFDWPESWEPAPGLGPRLPCAVDGLLRSNYPPLRMEGKAVYAAMCRDSAMRWLLERDVVVVRSDFEDPAMAWSVYRWGARGPAYTGRSAATLDEALLGAWRDETMGAPL